MKEIVANADKLPQVLKQYSNKEGFVEIYTRCKNGRFKECIKLAVNKASKSETAKETMSQLLKSSKVIEQTLGNVNVLSHINVIMSGINLAVTAAGFIIMYAELKKISGKIDEVLSAVKKEGEKEDKDKFSEVLNEYERMIDHKKVHTEYTEDEYVVLIGKISNCINRLLYSLNQDIAYNKYEVVYSIYTLTIMMSVCICDFDEKYYYAHKDTFIDGQITWYTSHERWMEIFKELESKEFKDHCIDVCFLDKGLHQIETDIAVDSIISGIKEAKDAIEIEQKLLQMTSMYEEYKTIQDAINKQVSEELDEVIPTDLLKDNGKYKTAVLGIIN